MNWKGEVKTMLTPYMSEQDPVTGLIEKVTDAEARAFLDEFLVDRKINTEYYKRVSEHKLDFKMVDKGKTNIYPQTYSNT